MGLLPAWARCPEPAPKRRPQVQRDEHVSCVRLTIGDEHWFRVHTTAAGVTFVGVLSASLRGHRFTVFRLADDRLEPVLTRPIRSPVRTHPFGFRADPSGEAWSLATLTDASDGSPQLLRMELPSGDVRSRALPRDPTVSSVAFDDEGRLWMAASYADGCRLWPETGPYDPSVLADHCHFGGGAAAKASIVHSYLGWSDANPTPRRISVDSRTVAEWRAPQGSIDDWSVATGLGGGDFVVGWHRVTFGDQFVGSELRMARWSQGQRVWESVLGFHPSSVGAFSPRALVCAEEHCLLTIATGQSFVLGSDYQVVRSDSGRVVSRGYTPLESAQPVRVGPSRFGVIGFLRDDPLAESVLVFRPAEDLSRPLHLHTDRCARLPLDLFR